MSFLQRRLHRRCINILSPLGQSLSAPPVITSVNDSVVEVDIGQSVTLFCAASGTPIPNVTWVRADGSLLKLPSGGSAVLRVSYYELSKSILVYLIQSNSMVRTSLGPWRQEWFEPLRIHHSTRSGGKWD